MTPLTGTATDREIAAHDRLHRDHQFLRVTYYDAAAGTFRDVIATSREAAEHVKAALKAGTVAAPGSVAIFPYYPEDTTEPPYELVRIFNDGKGDIHDYFRDRDAALAAFDRMCTAYPEGTGKTVDIILY